MILVAILALSGVVLYGIYQLFAAFPALPQTFGATIAAILPYVARGVTFINGFIYPEIVWPLATACLIIHQSYVSYRIYMWVVKKIPMLGVSD